MKVIAINGSPRKNWNTDLLCQKALEGAASLGADIELIHLNDYTFKGCVSCFGCHLKRNINKFTCFYKDELSEVLDKCLEADVIIIGSPNYYGFVLGTVRSFMERLLFPLDTYYADDNKQRILKRNKVVPCALIYTMNARKEQIESRNGLEILKNNENALRGIFGYCESFYSFDTCQFKDYEPYTVNIFNPIHKQKQWDEQLPKDLQNAYELGKRLVRKVEEKRV